MSPSPSAERTFPNPFGPLLAQPLDARQVDVADINAESFEACRRLVGDVASGGYSAALTVFGDSGTGKTHLVGRVRRWLESQPGKLFVFVRMETSAAGIWRHLRRCLADSLLHAKMVSFEHRRGSFEMLANRDLSIVLEHLLAGRQVRDCAAWLRGEGLPEEILSTLQLSAPGPDDDAEAASRHVVIEICSLLRPGVVVWCMDQIEAVMSSPADRDGPHAFGRAVSCLVDETHNSSVICCEQSSFVNLMEQILDGAAKSRVLGRRAAIRPLSWEQAQRVIAARLDTAPELTARRASHGGCWPLEESQVKAVFVDDAAPARKVIARCKDLFDQWQSGRATVVEPLDEALQKMFDDRFEPKTPEETEAILRNAMPLLARSAGLKCSTTPNRSPLDFTLDGGRIAIAICNAANLSSLAHRLKKIQEAWKPAGSPVLVLLRDERRPIARTAKVSHRRIAAIQAQGGRLVAVSEEAVEALAALRRLLSDAESGDLAHHGEPVTSGAVERWIAGHMPDELKPLLSVFGAAPPIAGDLTPVLAALLAEKKIVKLEEAARSLKASPEEVEQCARRDPRRFCLLGGSVPTLFQPVATTREEG
jgi:hypothetical protein